MGQPSKLHTVCLFIQSMHKSFDKINIYCILVSSDTGGPAEIPYVEWNVNHYVDMKCLLLEENRGKKVNTDVIETFSKLAGQRN